MAALIEIAGQLAKAKISCSPSGSDTSLPPVFDARSGTTKQDHLGYGPYAEALAFVIDCNCSKLSLTVAISGPWGAGS